MKRRNGDRESPEPPRRQANNIPVSTDADEISNLPYFNPSSSNNLSAEKWIESIEYIREIYDWDDRMTLSRAVFRLDLEAHDKSWLKENLRSTWSEFKVKFIRRFSKLKQTSKAEYFERLICRRHKRDEDYENYVRDVQRIARKSDCSDDDTIIYIILGLDSHDVRKRLFSMKCNTVDDLLLQIKKIAVVKEKHVYKRNPPEPEPEPEPEPKRSVNEESDRNVSQAYERDDRPRTSRNLRQTSNTSEIKEQVMCVRCNKFGHNTSECYFIDENFCSNCGKIGHKSRDCSSTISQEADRDRRYRRRDESGYENPRTYCTICQKKGHHTRSCMFTPTHSVGRTDRDRNEDVRADKADSNKRCAKCRNWGHFSVNCPENISNGRVDADTNSKQVSERAEPSSTSERKSFEQDLSNLLDVYIKDLS